MAKSWIKNQIYEKSGDTKITILWSTDSLNGTKLPHVPEQNKFLLLSSSVYYWLNYNLNEIFLFSSPENNHHNLEKLTSAANRLVTIGLHQKPALNIFH